MSLGVNLEWVRLVLSSCRRRKPLKGWAKTGCIPVVCFQFLYRKVQLKQFVRANSDKSNLATFERTSFMESFLSCVLGKWLYTKHCKTFPGQQENKGQKFCFCWDLILAAHDLTTQTWCFVTMRRGARSLHLQYNHWLLCAGRTNAAVYCTS